MNEPLEPPDDASRRRDDDETPEGHFSALVPERVARGLFTTGAAVLEGPDEFLIDFFLRMSQPHLLTARIVLPHTVMPRFIVALRENLAIYQRTFGTLPAAPRPTAGSADQGQPMQTTPEAQPAPPPAPSPAMSLEEMYSQLKLSDEVLAGTYANAVLIGHSATEFSFDFITNFFPRSVVSARVFMAAGQVAGFLEALVGCYEAHRRKRQ